MMSNYTENWGAGKIDFVSLTSGSRLRYLKTGTGRALVLMHTLRTQLDYVQKLERGVTWRFLRSEEATEGFRARTHQKRTPARLCAGRDRLLPRPEKLLRCPAGL
jgi:hypothetical protein